MIETKISIPVDFWELHIILFCIIEHWRMPQYEEQLSSEEFRILKDLRDLVLTLRDSPKPEVLTLTPKQLRVMLKAYPIGFGELKSAGDFETIVGRDVFDGEWVLNHLKSFL